MIPLRYLMRVLTTLVVFGVMATVTFAAPITLQNPTATHEQGGWPIAGTIDGDLLNGWAFCVGTGCGAAPEAGVWQTTAPLTLNAVDLTFDLYFGCPNCGLGHKFQDFQISYTTSANPTASSGALWTVLTPSAATASYATLSISGNHVLATGNQANADLYSVTMENLTLSGITGFKMNVYLGPNGHIGFSDASNGNAVLGEFKVSSTPTTHVPEPASIALLGIGLVGLGFSMRRKPAAS